MADSTPLIFLATPCVVGSQGTTRLCHRNLPRSLRLMSCPTIAPNASSNNVAAGISIGIDSTPRTTGSSAPPPTSTAAIRNPPRANGARTWGCDRRRALKYARRGSGSFNSSDRFAPRSPALAPIALRSFNNSTLNVVTPSSLSACRSMTLRSAALP